MKKDNELVRIGEELHNDLISDVGVLLGELYIHKYLGDCGVEEVALQDFQSSLLNELELTKLLSFYDLLDFNNFSRLITRYVNEYMQGAF